MIDKDLERAIDMAGRDRVFAVARENGWQQGSSPPKWVWRQIIGQLALKDSRGRK